MGDAGSAALPTGRVALLFSDIERSTALLNRLGPAYGDLLDQHDEILRRTFAQRGGHEFSNEGDSFGAAFADPADAAQAALEVQERVARHAWPSGEQVRVRMGLHYGEPKVRGNDYWGEDVHFAARICSAAHGGQVVVSAAMRAGLGADAAVSLGHHGLKDFPTPRELFQLVSPGHPPEHFPAPTTLSTFHNNLPSIAAPLIGRDGVVAELSEMLTTGRRLVTVIGPGGMGKTRLAVAVGERLATEFADGVAYVALSPVDADHAPAALAEATGAPLGGDPLLAAREHLRHRRMLVVLDNCEHLVDAAATLALDLLEHCPDVAVLATAQVPLGLFEETLHRLEPLTSGGGSDGAGGSAIEMLVARSQARDSAFSVGAHGADRASVERLCALLEGLPLAIELASARIRVFGVERLVAALERDVDALGSAGRDMPARQQSLRAALDWTLSLLTTTEQDVFAAFAAFAESWSIEQAEGLFDGELDELAVWDALSRLIDASLVLVKGDGRFAMPERVRRHAVELLAASPLEDRRRRRHAEVVGQEMRELTLTAHVDYRRMLANIADLLPEVLQALHWTRDTGDHRHLIGLTAPGLAKLGRLAVVAEAIPDLVIDDEARGYDDAAVAFAEGLLHGMRWSTDSDAEVTTFERAARGYLAFGDVREAVIAGHRAAGALEAADQVGAALDRMDEMEPLVDLIADPRWREEWERRGATFFELDAAGLEHRRRVLARWGVGTGTYSVGHSYNEAMIAGLSGDPTAALALSEQALREVPRQQLNLTLDHVKCVAWLLAETGRGEPAVELHAAIDAVYRARTGAGHGDVMPEFTRAFAEAEQRLGDEAAAAAQARGAALSYSDLVDRALQYATGGVKA
ncbi:adenylate/guanylate cyclase domain-containing protein [Nocardioides humilatus]|uniref:Adenylate/guanylate cyclase domain-containing protein n=1 Tax=Nocardioides humilatus TaxID=2607660 RepID=A0A5B1L4B4_9ACTN|nr:adenylate/guanylate cyclase domain-containing protein [Nocardioides humilatus]KAA1415276.1 adenylate/guanylate cyclase domain-containing protein [Nocardioides humilatus]